MLVRGLGIVLEEPTVAAVERKSGDVVDVGRSALELAERLPDSIEIAWPMRNGAVADAGLANRFLTRLIRPYKGDFWEKTRLVITVASSTSPIERRSVRDAGKRAGGAQVFLIEHVMAAALGTDLPIHEPVGTMIVDVGAGITEAALLSLGSIVASSGVRSGSADVDIAIKNVLRRDYGIVITAHTAEEIKLAISDVPSEEQVMIEARGHATVDGATVTAILEREEVQNILDDYVAASIDAVRATLVQAPPELGQDIILRGVHLAGGGAMLGGLARRLSEEFVLPVHVMPDASRAAVRGAGKCLEAPDTLRDLFLSGS